MARGIERPFRICGESESSKSTRTRAFRSIFAQRVNVNRENGPPTRGRVVRFLKFSKKSPKPRDVDDRSHRRRRRRRWTSGSRRRHECGVTEENLRLDRFFVSWRAARDHRVGDERLPLPFSTGRRDPPPPRTKVLRGPTRDQSGRGRACRPSSRRAEDAKSRVFAGV